MKRTASLIVMMLLFLSGTTAWADVSWDQYAPETSITAGKTYVIRSCNNKNFYLRMNPGGFCNNSNDPKGQTSNDDPKTYQWTLEATEGGYALKNVASGTYVSTSVSGYGPTPSTAPIEFAVTYNSELSAFTISNSSKYLNFSAAYYINFSETAPTMADASTCWSFYELKESVTYVPTKRASSLVAGKNYMIFNASIIDNGGKDISGFATHSYGVDGVKLESAKPSQYSSTSKNCLWQVSDNSDGSYKLISVATGKQVNAEGNEADEDVIIVNYENNPKKVWDGVSAWLEDEETTVVSSGIKANDLLWAIHNEGETKGWNGNADGFATDGHFEPYAFYEVKSYTTEQFELEENVKSALANVGKVGYPKDTEANNALQAALEEAYNADHADADYWTNLKSAYDDYASITDVNLPVNGKAYNIYAVFPDGSRQAMYWNGEKISTSSNTADPFVCRTTDNSKFVLVNNNGGYLSWFSDEKGYKPNVGVTDGYAVVDGKAYNDLTLTRATADKVGGSVQDGTTDATLFGRLHIQGLNTDGGTWYLAVRDDGKFIAGNAADKWYDLDTWNNANKYRTVTYTFEEVSYANLVNFAAEAKIGEDYVATFAAPYPAVVPDNVEAYAITGQNGDYAALSEPIASGNAIPAGEGALLVSKSVMSNVAMLPAAGESTADMSGNLLERATGEAVDATTTAYILANGNDDVGFYLLNDADRTIGMNKAYLAGLQSGAVVKLNFGGNLTGIDAVDNGELTIDNAPVYDLSGRVVANPTKGGVYIKNGKKFIVK